MSLRVGTNSTEQTLALGRAVGRLCRAGDVVALVGELGAGKTRFTRGLAQGMGVGDEGLASPTFVMVQEHAPTGPGAADRPRLVHIDAYRLRSLADLESVGWEDLSLDGRAGGELRRGAVLAIEWADRLVDCLDADALRVTLSHAGETRREAVFECPLSWAEREAALGQAIAALRLGRAEAAEGPSQSPSQAAPSASTTACPICAAPVAADATEFPFCSPRCKWADLGRWMGGGYRVTRPMEQADVEEE